MNKTIKNIYYRGVLSSCNYSCSYCPFAKRKISQLELDKDYNSLQKFRKKIEQEKFKNSIGIFFTPYGEALIHDYYIETMSKLSKLPNIKYVSCQTNLSFDLEKFLKIIKDTNGNFSKIKLWASYHPEMINGEVFAEKVEFLQNYIEISVGMVAIPNKSDEVLEFKEQLPKETYLWINGKAKEKKKYTEDEIKTLVQIDPLFKSELTKHKVQKDCCTAGIESIFIEANGDIYPCNINKLKIGNLYEASNELKFPTCNRKDCDCFLAYIHRKDVLHENYFSTKKYIRTPNKIKVEAIFLDIDGTITNKKGVITSKTIECIKKLSKTIKIYLATSLPYEIAMKKCRHIKEYISGGIFGNGGLIIDNFLDFFEVLELNQSVSEKCSTIKRANVYYWNNIAYKAVIPSNLHSDNFLKNTSTDYTKENHHTSYYSNKASKLKSILRLCTLNNYEKHQVIVMGNSQNDIEMIEYFPYSIATINADNQQIKNSANYVMNIEHLMMFVEF